MPFLMLSSEFVLESGKNHSRLNPHHSQVIPGKIWPLPPKPLHPNLAEKKFCSIKNLKDLPLCNNLSYMFHNTKVGSVDIREKGVSRWFQGDETKGTL